MVPCRASDPYRLLHSGSAGAPWQGLARSPVVTQAVVPVTRARPGPVC